MEVPDYLSTQFVLDNIQHFKSTDHLTPRHQQQRATCNKATSPPPKPDRRHQGCNTSTPTRQRRSMARTFSDIVPDDISTQLAMEDIDQYRSTDHYRTSRGSSKPTWPSTPHQDRVRIISLPHPTATATPSTTASSSDSQEYPNKRRSGIFSPFKPLFPPPPVVEKRSPKRKSTPKRATPKKRQLQEFSIVDDTDPIEDGDSDSDWQVFWEAGKKDVVEGNDAKRHHAAVSPSLTPSRPVLKSTTTRPALKPPEPLGPKLLQIFREEAQQKGSIAIALKNIRQGASVLEPTPVKKSSLLQQPTPGQLPTSVQKKVPVRQPITVQKLNPVHQPALTAPSSTLKPTSPSVPHTIPLEPRVVSFSSKLTPIKDLSPNEPQKKYHIMGLIQLISPVQDGVRGFGGKATSKAGLTICDKGSIHLNITLWGDKGKWIESCNVGDVVLLTGKRQC